MKPQMTGDANSCTSAQNLSHLPFPNWEIDRKMHLVVLAETETGI
jgi:hypothetical protein